MRLPGCAPLPTRKFRYGLTNLSSTHPKDLISPMYNAFATTIVERMMERALPVILNELSNVSERTWRARFERAGSQPKSRRRGLPKSARQASLIC